MRRAAFLAIFAVATMTANGQTLHPEARGITQVPGIRVGHFTLAGGLTGCTVVLADGEGAVGGVAQRGGAPGTRETDLLDPTNLVERVNAIVLSGGSAFGLDAAQGVMRYLEERYLPGLTRHIVAERRVDPRYFRDTLNSHLGSAFSVEPTLTQSAWFRPHNQSEDVPNLYLVGAGTHPGAGVPGVLSSGKIVADLIGAAS